jgi:hypothetical protein
MLGLARWMGYPLLKIVLPPTAAARVADEAMRLALGRAEAAQKPLSSRARKLNLWRPGHRGGRRRPAAAQTSVFEADGRRCLFQEWHPQRFCEP